MTAEIWCTTVDCDNPYELSEWWKQVLGYADLPDDPNLPDHTECLVRDPETGHRLLFIRVPDTKQVKNRLHFDIAPRAGRRDDELVRLLELGATQLDDLRKPDGTGWVVLADPEGNEFCILRSEAERQAAPPAGYAD
jgi:hypothetical protein